MRGSMENSMESSQEREQQVHWAYSYGGILVISVLALFIILWLGDYEMRLTTSSGSVFKFPP